MSKRSRLQFLIAAVPVSCASGASFLCAPFAVAVKSPVSTTAPFLRLIANLLRIAQNVASVSQGLLQSFLGHKIVTRRGCRILGLGIALRFFQAIKKTDIKSAFMFFTTLRRVRIICVM